MLRLLKESGNEPENILFDRSRYCYPIPIAAIYIQVPVHELRRRR
ncbi:hypothetical protein ACJIZ3_009051 [Penstemon smallii]|uniref:Uncharacterized protein n=1 Tax=Penstemon smallii TaxID=265156 RepID=A0ABD3TC93_9LAMI